MEILSPVNGYVMARNVVDDQHVMEGTVIYEVANLDHLWVTLDAYEEDIDWISTGNTDRIPDPLESLHTPMKRPWIISTPLSTLKNGPSACVPISKQRSPPAPDMLVTGILHAEQREEKLMVPVSSVLWTGPRSLVYMKDTDADTPRFMVREVDLGPKSRRLLRD
jgi:membrane fusion protein, copper/silver efflux system